MQYETELKELTASVPSYTGPEGDRKYPDDYLSAVLTECYLPLLELTSLYFNLAFSSHITRFLVQVVYSLECWEIYHLLRLVPSISYFLRLVDIAVTETPLGPIVSPPQNFMGFNLRQGFQYPFPYPSYNFSYHTCDPYATAKKYARVHITPYIDIRLKKTKSPSLARQARSKPDARLDWRLSSPSRQPNLSRKMAGSRSSKTPVGDSDSEGSARPKVYTFMEYTPRLIELECQMLKAKGDLEEDDSEYDTDAAAALDHAELAKAERPARSDYTFVPSRAGQLPSVETRRVKTTPGAHQCQNLDPTTGRPCLKIFYGRNELQRHEEFVHATLKKIYRCVYCEQQGNHNQCYPRHDSLARHIRRKHGITGRENKAAVELAKKNAEIVDDLAAPRAKPNMRGSSTEKDSTSPPPPDGRPRNQPLAFPQETSYALPPLSEIKPMQMPYRVGLPPLYQGTPVGTSGVTGMGVAGMGVSGVGAAAIRGMPISGMSSGMVVSGMGASSVGPPNIGTPSMATQSVGASKMASGVGTSSAPSIPGTSAPQPWFPSTLASDASKKRGSGEFQKFRFPSNYYPPGALYGPVYGTKNTFVNAPFPAQPLGHSPRPTFPSPNLQARPSKTQEQQQDKPTKGAGSDKT